MQTRLTFLLTMLLTLSVSPYTWADDLVQFDAQGEPTIQSVHKAALQYAALHPEIFKSMRNRSRIQAALPQVTLRVTSDLDKEDRALTRFDENNSTIPQNISATETNGNDLQLYAEARWKLNESVFNFQETAVMRENRYSAKERQKLLQTVTQVYFERKRALIKMKPAKPNSEAAALAQLKIAQIEAELDALTGGWFTKALPPKNGG
ncbi:MAG: hypothetical protein CMH49_02345 [Myxococcales bacterium]|nr:hypothetical protein [Myxococcales bacterium]